MTCASLLGFGFEAPSFVVAKDRRSEERETKEKRHTDTDAQRRAALKSEEADMLREEIVCAFGAEFGFGLWGIE